MDNMFEADDNERGGSPLAETGFSSAAHSGGAGSEQDGVESSVMPGNPHSSSGFRRALRHQSSGSNRLIGKVKGPKNRMFQGGGRHGLHIGGSQGHFHGSPSGGGL
jgi:hypothetical protein